LVTSIKSTAPLASVSKLRAMSACSRHGIRATTLRFRRQ
jgi:hypothetical protein